MIRGENDVRRANKAGRLAPTHGPKRAILVALLLHPIQKCVHLSRDLLAEVVNFREAKTACALPL
jgi:hypothetical protein